MFNNCLIFKKEIPIPEKMVFILKQGPGNNHKINVFWMRVDNDNDT